MNLDSLFKPESIAIIGASRDEKSVGYGIVANLVKGGVFATRHNEPFKGYIYPVNPKADEILGLKCYKSILEVKNKVELAIIAVKAAIVPLVMKECVKKKVKSVIII